MKRRALTGLLTFAMLLASQSLVAAKARVVAVFPLRSTAALAKQSESVTKLIVARIAALDGYDAKIVPPPGIGALGAAGALVGAQSYVVGQLTDNGTGFEVSLGAFESATDRQFATYKVSIINVDSLPAEPDVKILVEPGAVPTSASGSFDTGSPPLLPGTAVGLYLDEPLASNSATTGEVFGIHSAADVYSADGSRVIILKGAPGRGEVESVDAAGGNGHGGKVTLQFDWIVAADGSKIPLSNTPSSNEGGDNKGGASTATIATYLLLGPLGLFAHNFVRGRDAQIDTKTKLTGYVDHTVRVNSPVTVPPLSAGTQPGNAITQPMALPPQLAPPSPTPSS